MPSLPLRRPLVAAALAIALVTPATAAPAPAWTPFSPTDTPQVDKDAVKQMVDTGRVILAEIDEISPKNSVVFLRTTDGHAWRYGINTLHVAKFMEYLIDKKVQAIKVQPTPSFEAQARMLHDGVFAFLADVVPLGAILGQLLMIIAFVFVLVWVQMKATKLITGKRIRAIKPKDIPVSFEHIAGIDEAVRDVREAVAFLARPNDFSRLGAKLPKGILLVGPPGGGKTMLAKAFAKACDAPFYAVSGSEFVEMFVGMGASRVRSLFKKARRSRKAVIFIDEIDALAKKRGGMSSHSESEQTLNELLVQMDGIDNGKSHIIVIAATNRMDAMDDAVLRPGRFDRIIQVSAPSLKGREDILRVYLKEHLGNPDIDAAQLARICVGFSGAQLSSLVNEALIRAAREGKDRLSQTDLLAARDKLLMGDPRQDLDLLESERRTTAIHESGHAVVALTVSGDPVEKVTIEPRSQALGLVLQVPERDAVSLKESEIRARLQVLLGGRAAEEVFFGDVTTGASNDMERAYQIALSMVAQWGMGESLGRSGVADLNQVSGGTRERIEREAVVIVNRAYDHAREIVLASKDAISRMADKLMEQVTLDKQEVLQLMEQKA